MHGDILTNYLARNWIARAVKRAVSLICLSWPLHILADEIPKGTEEANASQLETITVTATRDSSAAHLSEVPAGVGNIGLIGPKEIARNPSGKLEEVLQSSGLGTADAGSSFGLAPSIGVRGFSVNKQSAPGLSTSRILLNGHPDIAHGFNRDMSTVERVEVMGGFDATMNGAGSPGGSIQYQSKRPTGTDAAEINVAVVSDGLKRLTIDAEKTLGAFQMRLAAASQRSQKTVEGQPTDRDSILLSTALATEFGIFRLDGEYQNNRAPYIFGTHYANGHFWYDKPYVSPQSKAKRAYSRGALYWDHELSENTYAKAWFQQAHVSRDETLVGFWDIADDALLNGYYREKVSTFDQQDFGASVQQKFQTWGVGHEVTGVLQSQTQHLDFDGPQSISEYTISIQDPVWPVDLSALTLTPRIFQERYTEKGIALADAMQLADSVQLRVGVRHSSVNIDTADNTTTLIPTATMRSWTHSEGLAWRMTEHDTFWLSRADSFEPVRGQTRDGGYLPPQNATQWEAGYKRQDQTHFISVSAFDIRQDNLPGKDPADRNYLVPVGSVHSQGVTLSGKAVLLGLSWQANATYQDVRVAKPVSATQGNFVPGTPHVLGAVNVGTPEKSQGVESWVSAFGTGRRPADSKGTIYAPGFVRWDVGASYKQGAWQVAALIQNIFDLRYVQALNASDNVWQGPRRSYSLNLSAKF